MRHIFILIVALNIHISIFSQSSDTIIYSIVAAGQVKGFDKTWKTPDGSFHNWYQFNDRGRGDSMRITYREDEQGFPIYIRAAGHDYMKNSVYEEFALENGIARWKNNSEDQQRSVTGKQFYSGLKAGGGDLFKALKKNGNKINMLPYGNAELSIVQNYELKHGDKTLPLRLISIKGLGFTPSYSWINAEDKPFAYVNEWQSQIRQGYESHIDELLNIQKKYEAAFFSNLAATLPVKNTTPVLFQGVSIFDANKAVVLNNKDVLVENGVIKQIATGNSIKSKATIIKGKGKTLVPGLWDMHVHFSSDIDGLFHMAAGVTHVRDMGSSELLLKRIKDIKEGNIIGPRVEIMSGFIDGAGEFAAPTGTLINNIDEGKKAINDFADKGYQQIKLYSSLKPEWIKPLIDEAKKRKLRVAGHIPAFMTATQAIEKGYDEVTHLNMLVLNFFGDTVDTRSPLRFRLPAAKAASIDLNGNEFKQFIRLLKQKNVAVDPTVSIFEDMFTSRDKVVAEKFKPIIENFPLQMQRYIRAGGGGLPVPENMDKTYRESYNAFLKITKTLYDNGIKILAGTDGFAGFDLHRELELYVIAGIPANKVLQLATLGAAQYTGKSSTYGIIQVGKPADMFLVEGNPVENISNIRRTKMVITQGKLFDPAKLYQSISIKPF